MLLAPQIYAADTIDFNRDIRPILSNKCYTCHGNDDAERQAGLRLDIRDAAVLELESGETAIIPSKAEESALYQRVASTDDDVRMPPADSAKQLSLEEIAKLKQWIVEGAKFAKHWSYVKPIRPQLPPVKNNAWIQNDVDRFILARLERAGKAPAAATDRYAFARRVSLDVTGLPPTIEEVDAFVNDKSADAYDKYVDRLLAKRTFGEHWARMWLDLARYADSAGYADDPARTIWGFRDYVIRSINANKPFDQFTVEQIAGDLLENPTQEQLIATAFHRNTLTNNEGGTNDEEFRNVAVVDRVNTTMAVWMGTTANCAQCHNHKFDPISQEEYFQLFAVFNSSQDADRRDESPRLDIRTVEQDEQKQEWIAQAAAIEKELATPTAQQRSEQAKWEAGFALQPKWNSSKPAGIKLAGAKGTVGEDGTVVVDKTTVKNTYTVQFSPVTANQTQTAIRLETVPSDSLPGKGAGFGGGNFIVTRVLAAIHPAEGSRLNGRFVRVENTGNGQLLSLAEVQVFSGADNIALKGAAKQSTTGFGGPAQYAIDGNTDGNYEKKSTTHTTMENNPWWEVDLKSSQAVDRIVIWNRTDNNLQSRLANFKVTVLDEQRKTVWEKVVADPPRNSSEFSLSGIRGVKLVAAYADYAQANFVANNVLDSKNPNATGWAVGGQIDQKHQLTLIPEAPIKLDKGSSLSVTIEQLSSHENHTLGQFRFSTTSDVEIAKYAETPAAILAVVKTSAAQRTAEQKKQLSDFHASISPLTKAKREELAQLQKQIAASKASTSVPIMRELPKPRVTKIQRRGNYLETGKEVIPGIPSTLFDLQLAEGEKLDRLKLAKWLVNDDNPLTARVIANRYWEAVFGVGLVETSEEFGSQGELPSHPELLDWLAVELIESGWDTKHLLKLLVTSSTYQQSSKVTDAQYEADPDNRLLARGPRFRLSAEMIRDQALFAGGLLSEKMYGPPVKPMQPSMGLRAAFGSGTDWKTSDGEDRHRRGLYTTWRRSNPYPSMATFDAPNRQVCVVRRARTNTPLQALVTLNDPVYVEAAQSLARRVIVHEGDVADKANFGFRLCASRHPNEAETKFLVDLFEEVKKRFAMDTNRAMQMATKPIGPAPEGADVTELAAWTVVGNVLLNLDEMFMKR
jgi:hypothetical protein